MTKPLTFQVSKPSHLALLDEIAIEIEGDRHQALGHILDLTQTARAMVPIIPEPGADRDVIGAGEPPDDGLGEFLVNVIP
jgi:hypothetical protein